MIPKPDSLELFKNISVAKLSNTFTPDSKDLTTYTNNDRLFPWDQNFSYSPCVKYHIPADPVLDGTDRIYIGESMHFWEFWDHDRQYWFTDDYYWAGFLCDLNFSCKNNQKLLYRIVKVDLSVSKSRSDIIDFEFGVTSKHQTRQGSQNISFSL